jgi:hypothetical protein
MLGTVTDLVVGGQPWFESSITCFVLCYKVASWQDVDLWSLGCMLLNAKDAAAHSSAVASSAAFPFADETRAAGSLAVWAV